MATHRNMNLGPSTFSPRHRRTFQEMVIDAVVSARAVERTVDQLPNRPEVVQARRMVKAEMGVVRAALTEVEAAAGEAKAHAEYVGGVIDRLNAKGREVPDDLRRLYGMLHELSR